jgi:transcriptional regulator with XRE-family HTH domain
VLLVRGAAVSADAVRAYVAELRDGRGFTQEEFARAIGMPKRTYQAWETGETEELKTSFLLRAIRVLHGSFQFLGLLENASAEEGERLARSWLALTSEQQQLADEFAVNMAALASLPDQERVMRLLTDLRREAQYDVEVLNVMEDLLRGRRQRRNA